MDIIRCPVCRGDFYIYDLFLHMFHNHQEFLAVWMALNNPPAAEYYFDDSYEALSELCEQLGNHTIPTNPEQVSDIIDNVDEAFTCPVCLENVATNVAVRKLRCCDHQFCDICITKWLESSKTCPICKKDSTAH